MTARVVVMSLLLVIGGLAVAGVAPSVGATVGVDSAEAVCIPSPDGGCVDYCPDKPGYPCVD